jgi:hypothetical protein
VGIRCADHATPSYQLKLALTSPAVCGRSVGIVRLWTKTMEFFFIKDWYLTYFMCTFNYIGFFIFKGIISAVESVEFVIGYHL